MIDEKETPENEKAASSGKSKTAGFQKTSKGNYNRKGKNWNRDNNYRSGRPRHIRAYIEHLGFLYAMPAAVKNSGRGSV